MAARGNGLIRPRRSATGHPLMALERTYLRKRGRMTRGQQRALRELAPRLCVAAPPASRPLGVEIGFGMGQGLAQWAEQAPDWSLVGIEVYQPGIGALLLQLDRRGLDNVRVIEGAAEAVLAERFADGSIDELRVLFPDPWPKLRHHKRRLIQPDFVELLSRKLAVGGRLHLATDWAPYAEWMLEVMGQNPDFDNVFGAGAFAPDRQQRPATRFEARGERLGHQVRDLLFRKR